MAKSTDPYRKDSSIATPSSGGARPPPSTGEVIGGKYRIETVIGQGGMGAVYRARHLLTERAVAVKWMLPEVGGEEAVQRFLREARAMGRIDHAGVVGVLDVGVDDGATFLVMELLRGSSLRDLLETNTRFEPAEAIGLLMPALEGVEAAHRNHVVHRDLKPENIFIVRTGDGTIDTTKVLDFGISKLRDDRLEQSPQVDLKKGGVVTRTGVTIGTPSYMSPEQVRGARDLDARTDIWSLGVILYELLTGEVPFRAESFGALLVAIATESYPRLDAVRPELPSALVAAVHRALEKDPNVRFPDVASFATALEPFGPPGCRFRVPDVSRPTDVSMDPAPAAPKAKQDLVGTAVARPRGDVPAATTPARIARPRLGDANDAGAPLAATAPPATRASEPDFASRGLDLSSAPKPSAAKEVMASARTALAGSAVPASSTVQGAAQSGGGAESDGARIPSLPPLALEDVPRRGPRPAPAPLGPRVSAPARPPARPAAASRSTVPDSEMPDARRYLKIGGALLVGTIVIAVTIRFAMSALRPSPVTEPTTHEPVAPVVIEPSPPARASAHPSMASQRPMPAWPPPSPPPTAAPLRTGTVGDPRALAPPPPAAPPTAPPASSGAGRHSERREPRAPSAPTVTTAPTPLPTPPPAVAAPATMDTASGRTGSLSREEF